MGRCNNRRVQQAAQASRNTPSRARFSKGPPRKAHHTKRRSSGADTHTTSAKTIPTTTTNNNKNASVIDKISKRVLQTNKSRRVSSSVTNGARKRHPLDGVDISKLDVVTLSEESRELVTRLLKDLKVVEDDDDRNEDATNNETCSESSEEDNEEFNVPLGVAAGQSAGGYSEYDEDVSAGEEDEYISRLRIRDGENTEDTSSAGGENGDSSISASAVNEAVRRTPIFVHLTVQLSFSQDDAQRACVAIEDWNMPAKKSREDVSTPIALDSEKLSLAMDWLCLHLTDDALQAGFRPNAAGAKRTSSSDRPSSSGILLAGTGRTRPIPHSSISLAPPITSDQEWRDTLRRQSRKVGFLRLGFHHFEAEKACDATMHVSEKLSAQDDDEGLRVMLSMMEKEVLQQECSSNGEVNPADLEFAKSERQQEIQALEAIYDGDFSAKGDYDSGNGRYTVSIIPNDDLRPPAHSKQCKLHVLLRPGYPVISPPLLLFTNPTLPPSLLRRINKELLVQSHDQVGEPVVFTIVDFLANTVSDMQLDFIKEQRAKELEVEQIRLRREAGHNVEAIVEAQYANDGKIGKRQKARLRAAEKSYDQAEKNQKEAEERLRRQEERLESIKDQDKSIRQTFAERAVQERARKLIEEEAEKAARGAMSDAFNRGDNADVAREAARRARRKCLRDHGEDVPVSSDEANDGDDEETSSRTADESLAVPEGAETQVKASSSRAAQKGTPTTQAFMDRLRKYYYDAAEAKTKGETGQKTIASRNSGGNEGLTGAHFHFVEPRVRPIRQSEEDTVAHIPRPVPVPASDLTNVMTDVVRCQKEQPWLVAPEARVPVNTPDDSLGAVESRRMNRLSERLRKDLLHQIQAAEMRGESKPTDQGKSTNKTGSRDQRYHFMRSQRERLPAYEMRDEIVRTIAANQITVISGATGCGKTTQVPQLILDDMILNGTGAEANMIVTQPRRISAIGVSERIAAERCERVGDTAGYSIRLENKRSSKTRLLLCTTGIMLRRLQCDPDLASVSHVFVDEVHERDLNTDFLLIILKELLARRKSLKLVLMSATLNAETFSAYFGGCPTVTIPGRAHPVDEKRLEDILQLTGYEVQEGSDFALKTKSSRPVRFSKSVLRKMYYPKYNSSVISSLAIVDETVINYELLAELLENITLNNDEGAILVFMPGMLEITKAIEELYRKEIFQSSQVLVYPLHSSLSTAEQTAIFEVPPKGIRKIVVATNIAETSITIEDVVFVVDAGRVKENRKDEANEMPTLVETWVSRASAKQRRGRAGRVRPGIAYHMYSSHTHEHEMDDYQLPEMLRVGLEDLVLQILLLDLGEPTTFLSKAVNPPSALAMRNSLKLLEGLGAVEIEWSDDDRAERIGAPPPEAGVPSCGELSAESGLTALGFHLATLPVDPRVGKMMIYGALFECIDPALTIAASMSARSPFVSPFDKRDEADAARKEFATDGSDHLTTLKAFEEWKRMRMSKGDRAMQTFLRDNFLSRLTLFQMEELRRQFADLLVDIGFLPRGFRLPKSGREKGGQGIRADTGPNINSTNTALVKAVLCAGLYPNIIVAPRSLVRTDGGLGDKQAGECTFQSLKGEVYLHPCTIVHSERRLDSRYCCYHEIVKTSKTYVRDCTTVSEFALLLFGGSLQVYHTHGVVTIDGWLKFRIDAKPATLVKHLRAQMETILLKKIVSPEEDVTGTEEGKALIRAVSALFAREIRDIPEPSGADIVRAWTTDTQGSGGGHSQRQNKRGGRGGSRGGDGRNSGRGQGSSRGGRGRGRSANR